MIWRKGNRNSPTLQKGFTLLEVLIALLIATVGLLSLSSMQINAIKGNGSSNELTKATHLAQGMMEQLRDGQLVDKHVFRFIDMSSTSPGTLLDTGMVNGIDGHGEAGGPFNLHWQVAVHTAWSRSMTVTITWRSMLGLNRSVDITSMSRGDS